MLLERIYDSDLAQASYVVACQSSGEAIVVDPRRDVQVYLDLAERHGLRITHVTETHIHADYLSGTRELAAATGARIHLSGEGGEDWQYRFEGERLLDGAEIDLGHVVLRAVHTPGHTPEHLSFLITDTGFSSEPGYLLSGDFVFAGDLGRPDLLDEVGGATDTSVSSARTMFASLRDRFVTLPDWVQVLPAHGAGSACGKSLGAVPSTTIGYERSFAWWAPMVASGDEASFVSRLLDGQSEPHAYFGRMKVQNRQGPALRGAHEPPPLLSADDAARRFVEGRAVLLDTRDVHAVHETAVLGALCVPASSSRSTYSAWVLDPETEPAAIVILAADAEQASEFADNLLRVGIDHVAGYITSIEGLPSFAPETVAPADLEGTDHDLLLDVRNRAEHAAGHVPGSRQLHGGRALWEMDSLPRDGHLVVYCQSGLRASVVSSALRRSGFRVTELEGSYLGWQRHEQETTAVRTR